MNWWNSLLEWVQSAEGRRILTDAVLPFLAIVVAGVIAALIARSTGRRILDLHEREAKSAAVASLIASARTATTWSSLGVEERAFSDRLADESSVRLRLLPISGAGLAADWADHEISGIKANSSTFTFQAEQSLADVRDRLVEWQAKPARAKKLFRFDLERWKAEDDAVSTAAPTSGPRQAVASDDGPASVAPGLSPRADWNAGAGAPVATPSFATPSFAPPSESRVFEPPVESAQVGSAQVGSAQVGSAQVGSAQVEPRVGVAPIDAAASESAPSETVPARVGTPVGGVDETRPSDAGSPEVPETAARKPTGMVSTPVVQPPRSVASGTAAPTSPSDAADSESADSESSDHSLTDSSPSDTGSIDDREPAFSAPVSAHQVRRRTSPDRDDS